MVGQERKERGLPRRTEVMVKVRRRRVSRPVRLRRVRCEDVEEGE